MLLQKVIELFGIEDYFYALSKDHIENTSGKTELHSLNSSTYYTAGTIKGIIYLIKWRYNFQ